MDNSEKCGYMFVIVFVIWALGIFWHPFGTPNIYWHIILGVIMVGLIISGYVTCEDYKKDESEEEN